MTSTATSKPKPQKKKPRRKPHEAETDYARWAHGQMDLAAFERAERPKA
jgi:hypothetical protein